MIRVVIDTNVLIDASSDYHHYANRILDEVLAGDIEAYANSATIRENKFLTQKKVLDEGYLKKLNYYFKVVKEVNGSNGIKGLPELEDREDNKILESAVAAGADYLITSDHHLLKLETFQGVKIIRPDSFWQIWEEESETGWMKWINSFIK